MGDARGSAKREIRRMGNPHESPWKPREKSGSGERKAVDWLESTTRMKS